MDILPMAHVLAWTPGPLEIGLLLVVALLLFGKRLPEVMRSMGRGVVEFKKGIRGIEDDVDTESSKSSSQVSSTSGTSASTSTRES